MYLKKRKNEAIYKSQDTVKPFEKSSGEVDEVILPWFIMDLSSSA